MTYRKMFLLGGLLTPSLGFASDNSDIEVITTTASRFEASSALEPVALSQISQAQLQDIGVTHIEKAMQTVAGANLQHGNGQEYLPALRSQVLSGAGACGGLLAAEDGIPLRAAGFCNINELFESHFEAAERIEVLKGPNSVLYGSNAMHGVVNVISKDTINSAPELGLDYGSFGYTRARMAGGSSEYNLGAAATLTHDSGYREGESVSQQKLSLRHQYQGQSVSAASGLTYTHLDQDTAGYITGADSYKDTVAAKGNENPEAYRKAQSLRAWSALSWQRGESEILVKPYLRWQEMDFLKHFLPGKPLETNSQTGVGIQTAVKTPLAEHVTLNWGLDAEYTQGEMLQQQDRPTQGSAFLQATIPMGKHYDYQVDASQIAPYALLRWQQQQWTVDLGGRFESIRYDYDNFLPVGRTKADGTECGMGGCRYSRPASGGDNFSSFSPTLALSYRLDADAMLYANVSKGFRAPQTAELYQLQRAQQKAQLQEVQADNIEVGLKGATRDLRYQVALYRMVKDNLIFRDSDFFYINDGESSHEGVEVELNYRLSPQWQLDIAATYAEHRYEQDRVLNGVNINGNMLDTAPKVVATSQLEWQPVDSFSTALVWRHVGEYYTDPENLHRYEGHDLLSLRAKWQASPQLALTMRVKNLTDARYAERADFTSFSGERYFPGRPRNVMLSLDYVW
ncbi:MULTISPECIES: TonB-dependent receptor [unclassified Pseudoalteromonas]|uniref:TonB-dependent receptor n=1 Tax=unclassified Pseudoalteromonas TaxID=194690 RepID=UPI0030151B8D